MCKKNIVIILGVVFLVAMFIGYTKSFSNKVSKQILKWERENCSTGRSCELKLSDLTKFDWDTVYYFELNMSNEDVSKIINVSLKNYKGGHNSIVFIRDNKVVYIEYFDSDIEGYMNNELVFRGLVNGYGKYASNTTFRIWKTKVGSNSYFEIDPIRNLEL